MSTAEVLSPTSPTSVSIIAGPLPHLRTRAPTAVDQDGSFQMDKVIKSGWLLKRTRKTKVRRFVCFDFWFMVTMLTIFTIRFHRTGNAAGLSFVVIAFHVTRTKKNTKFTAKSILPSSPLLLCSRTPKNLMSLGFSHHPEIIISKANRQRILRNGCN